MSSENIFSKLQEELESAAAIEFPVEVFPKKLVRIIREKISNGGLVVDYLGSAILAAAATAIGNSRRVRVHDVWAVNPTLYVVFVGRPGLGKSPPIDAAFSAIYRQDTDRWTKYKEEVMTKRAKDKNGNSEPITPENGYKQTIISDFTLEALAQTHWINPRGVTIVNDEISTLFTSASRYNNSPFANQLLTAWSGGTLRYNRVSHENPIIIDKPCIGLLGTTQTAVFNDFLKSGNCRENGLLDRMILVFPRTTKLTHWAMSDDMSRSRRTQDYLDKIIGKLLSLDYDGKNLVDLEFSPEARDTLYSWQNDIIDTINATVNDIDIDSRLNKLVVHVSRFALILQCLRWACGECKLTEVDLESVQSAIKLNDYFQDCYMRLMEEMERETVKRDASQRVDEFLSQCSDEFDTNEAVEIGKSMGVVRRTVLRWLSLGVSTGKISKLAHGRYAVARPGSDNSK